MKLPLLSGRQVLTTLKRLGFVELHLALVECLLTRQIGTIDPKLPQIQQLSNAQIELAEALLDFSILEDLVAWLQNHR